MTSSKQIVRLGLLGFFLCLVPHCDKASQLISDVQASTN